MLTFQAAESLCILCLDKWLNHACLLHYCSIDTGSCFLVQRLQISFKSTLWQIRQLLKPYPKSSHQQNVCNNIIIKVLSTMQRKEIEDLCICILIIWTHINYAIAKPTTPSSGFKLISNRLMSNPNLSVFCLYL